ncbi:hypothetical protein DFH06DRAFT_1122304 [Mycena polygramma]|nr:hypothetical protein DFH06DRAFT_1122304 [Mycena polygramma]
MDHAPPPEARSATTSMLGHPGAVSSGMFSGAQNFTVTGHTLQNNIYAAPAVPPDYRMIPLGDLDLQREICVDKSTGVVHLRRPAQRRVYSAKLQDQTVTVAMYRGDAAAENWQREVETYISLRHPNIMQIYGAASWGGMHAIVFHGGNALNQVWLPGNSLQADLVPFEDFMNTYKDFPCLTVSRCLRSIQTDFQKSRQYQEASGYLRPILEELRTWNCTMWIRRPTGRLCVDVMLPSKPIYIDNISGISISDSEAMTLFTGNAPDIEVLAIDALTLEAYHEVCYLSLGPTSYINICAGVTVPLGTVISRPTNNHFVEIASLPDVCIEIDHWANLREGEGEITENGWTRFNARELVGTYFQCWFRDRAWKKTEFWLSQANHIFKRCQITSNLQNYGMTLSDCFWFSTTKEIPAGFLFLCPNDDFSIGTSSVGWPTRPAYWSLDPSGIHPLSTEEAKTAGFPELQFTTRAWGKSWDSSVYAGLRKFHHGKGFDPYSQDVARHLGLPLFQLSGYVDPLFAHGKSIPPNDPPARLT